MEEKKKHISASWRKFERVVAVLETFFSPKGAIVTSPDKIPDKISGELREVDASIRIKAGSTDILVIVECRERSKKQDVQWIEQLATKQRSVGAHKTIAVTSKGLTAQAMKKAEFYEIAVRKLEKISTESIGKWIEFNYRHYSHTSYGFIVADTSEIKPTKPIEELTVFDISGKEILVDDILYTLWDHAFSAKNFPKKNSGDVRIKEYNSIMRLPKGTYFFKYNDQLIEWTEVVFTYTLEVTVKQLFRDSFAYSSPDNIIAEGYTYSVPDLQAENLFHRREDLELRDKTTFLNRKNNNK
jgi:hypothetical protein